MGSGFQGRHAALTLAATLLGITLQLTQGQYSPFGVAIMGLALLIGIAGAFVKIPLGDSTSRRFLLSLIILQLFVTLYGPSDDSIVSRGGTELLVHLIGGSIVLTAAILVVWARHTVAKGSFIAGLLVFGCMGIWRIHSVPEPFIDVHPMHTEAADALMIDENALAGA